ncbi:MAG: hypothetical protein ACK41Y_06025 [Paracoccus hibiscisoli]|uniref:hypothetical protein n=1 Tax=Paracoccus hibiscisoli TaxID=2023261 RepID=UPI003918B8BA
MANAVRAGDDDPVRWFGRRLWKFDGSPVFSTVSRPGYILAWQNMRNSINALGPVAGSTAAITALTQVLVDTITNAPMRLAPSELNANDFVFRKVGTGVDFGAIERGPGGINWNGVEQDTGRQFFTGGALVNPLNGQFEGPRQTHIRPHRRRGRTYRWRTVLMPHIIRSTGRVGKAGPGGPGLDPDRMDDHPGGPGLQRP